MIVAKWPLASVVKTYDVIKNMALVGTQQKQGKPQTKQYRGRQAMGRRRRARASAAHCRTLPVGHKRLVYLYGFQLTNGVCVSVWRVASVLLITAEWRFVGPDTSVAPDCDLNHADNVHRWAAVARILWITVTASRGRYVSLVLRWRTCCSVDQDGGDRFTWV